MNITQALVSVKPSGGERQERHELTENSLPWFLAVLCVLLAQRLLVWWGQAMPNLKGMGAPQRQATNIKGISLGMFYGL